jgi:hypothetical protein
MDEELINAYAYSNLQRAVLTNLLADAFSRETEPARALQDFYSDVRRDLQITEFPAEDPDAEKIRENALALAQRFFRDVELLLLKRGTFSETGLIV